MYRRGSDQEAQQRQLPSAVANLQRKGRAAAIITWHRSNPCEKAEAPYRQQATQEPRHFASQQEGQDRSLAAAGGIATVIAASARLSKTLDR